jgi:hypothetical protein
VVLSIRGEYAGKKQEKAKPREVILQMLEGYAEGYDQREILPKHVFEACQIGAKSL